MPLTITPTKPHRGTTNSRWRRAGNWLDRILGRESLPAEQLGQRLYRLGVGIDWMTEGGRHVGFLTVAHPFWNRSLRHSTDTVNIPEVSYKDFWLKAIVIAPKITSSAELKVDACVLELRLLTDPDYLELVGQAPSNLFPGNEQDRQNIINNSNYFPTTPVSTVDQATARAFGLQRASMHFEGTPAAQNWSLVTDFFDCVGDTDSLHVPDPPVPPRTFATGVLANYASAVRAVRRASSMARFDYGYSGQAWQVNGQLLGIQVGAINPDGELPGPIGYAHLVHWLVQHLEPLMAQRVSNYQAGSLRVVSVF